VQRVQHIVCGESWRRNFASLAANAARGPNSRVFTSTNEIFLLTAGLKDGASHCTKIPSSMYSALNPDPSDPDVIIKIDISNAFNVVCRQLTLDVLGGKASCDYACGLKEGDAVETVCGELRNMFEYFKAIAPPSPPCVTPTIAATCSTPGARQPQQGPTRTPQPRNLRASPCE
jgi:hypothetical protein